MMDGMHQVDVAVMDPQITAMSTSPYTDVPPQQDVDEFLRKKRKAREHKACYPCRQRKVKCDLNRPCQTCRDRDHPELCSYHPPNKRHSVDTSAPNQRTENYAADAGFVTLGRGEFDFLCRKLNTLEHSISELRREMRRNGPAPANEVYHGTNGSAPSNIDPAVEGRGHPPTYVDVHGIHMKNITGEYVHLGGGSIPAMLYALQMDQGHKTTQIQEMLGKTVLPLFGLDNESATYPFVDLWGLPHGSLARGKEIAKALPTDQQVLQLFHWYRDTAYVVYPGVVSTEELETEITGFLINRASQADDEGVTEQLVYGKSYSWLALLFAVLASGAQSSVVPHKERELTSQVYVCCSFECLRFSNFLSQSNLESLQSLLVIGNVMTNNLNAGISWSLLGLTIRLAQGLGIHRECPPNTSSEKTFPRSKIWWSIIWQDSLLSISYDRSSAAGVLDSSTMPPPQHYGSIDPYHAVMYNVSKVGLEIVRDRARPLSPREQIARITEIQDELAKIMGEAAEYLRDSRKCTTPRETLEHWGLYLHSSYHMSELCRPAVNHNADPELVKAFKQTCVANLVNTVEAFLGLNNITSLARQSWAALQRALGSALMLGIIGETSRNARARTLVDRFSDVISDMTTAIDPSEISAPLLRGLSALRKLSAADGKGAQETGGIGSIMTPPHSDHAGFGEQGSPYTVLNNILWGETGVEIGQN